MAEPIKKPTMSDIARVVGVSQATVSLVLNDAPSTRISPLRRRRVLEVAEELGYRKLPQSHRLGGVIGFLINELVTSQHAASLLEGARDEAAAHGCVLAVMPTQGVPQIENDALNYLSKRSLVGVVYATLLTQTVKPPDRLADMPAVLLNCHSPHGRLASVVPGDVVGAFTATSVLLAAGHRRVAMINGENWIEASRDRLQGYRQALTTHDIPVDPALIVSGGWTMRSGHDQADRLLDLLNPPTAIFCYCDRMALGAYDAVRSRGLRIPEDVSIVGFDDEAFAADMAPPLTTMLLPHENMARWAVAHLFETSTRSRGRHPKMKMECPLIERQSVCAANERLGATGARIQKAQLTDF